MNAAQKVAVLLELRNAADFLRSDGWVKRAAAVDTVSAAVAELIEADRAYDNVRSGVYATSWEVQQAAYRRAMALARIDGAA